MKDFIKSVLCELSEKQINRIKNTNKEFIFFDISVFNAGAVIRIKCTNKYKQINENNWNGYDFILESGDAVQCLKEIGK